MARGVLLRDGVATLDDDLPSIMVVAPPEEVFQGFLSRFRSAAMTSEGSALLR
jgi:hypothetical protein